MSLPVTADIDPTRVRRFLVESGAETRGASIREMNQLVNRIETELEVRFIRMEFGIPGLPLSPLARRAEAEALEKRNLGHVYAPFDGVPELKQEIARFVELFMGLTVPPGCCIPTIGAMQGCFAALALAGRMRADRKKVLFLQPGFPVNDLQARFLGLEVLRLDFHDHRGDELLRAVESVARTDEICAILWSSPNNPSWIILDEHELRGLGRICDAHDLIAIEDLAYFGMDVREDYFDPGRPPYQPTVLHHTDRGIAIISSSKMFSYAGQRCAMSVISPGLMDRSESGLCATLGTDRVGHAFVHGILYPMTACVPESPQYGLLALLRAANAGQRDLFAPAREYARRAKIMKRLFLDNGFRLVYDNDQGRPLADGFYFTVAYPGFADGEDLLAELMCYGVSAITLESTGSNRVEGLRACVSQVGDDLFPVLEQRLRRFHEDHRAA